MLQTMTTNLFILSSFIACLVYSYEFKGDEYHDYNQMTEFLRNVASEHSNITRLYSIGQSELGTHLPLNIIVYLTDDSFNLVKSSTGDRAILGRELWVLEISSDVDDSPSSPKPNVKLVANVHGNDPVTRQLLLAFARWLVEQHRLGDVAAVSLLDAVRLHLLPCLNPDGAAENAAVETPGTVGACGTDSAGWKNNNNVDIDNNFPDASGRTERRLQKETLAVMRWTSDVTFSLSASLKAGALIAVYPYHARPGRGADDSSNLTPDRDVFDDLVTSYARAHPGMHLGQSCPGDRFKFPNGVVNGALISPRSGSMMDFNYRRGCLEITLAISCCRHPPPADLPVIWADNKEALTWLAGRAAASGVRGSVVDECGAPVAGARLRVAGRAADFYSSRTGRFWRILPPGVYFLQVSADGFEPQEEVPASVAEDGRSSPVEVVLALSGRGRRGAAVGPRWTPKWAPSSTTTTASAASDSHAAKSCRGAACFHLNLYVFISVMVFTLATFVSLVARLRLRKSELETDSK